MNARAQKVYRSTWKDVRRFVPGQEQALAPPTAQQRGLGGALAEVQGDQLTLSRALVKSLAARKPQRRKIAQYALAHDFAHLYQDDDANSTQNRIEGGAETFARRIAKRSYGLTNRDLAPQSYSGAARTFRRTYGLAEAMRGQFGG